MDQTPLHDWHTTHHGRMVDFAGWSMPVQYSSIIEEHRATRTAAGLFDISHMGRLRFDGADAAAFLDTLVTRRVDNLKPGRIRYGLMTADSGGVLDDVLVYHMLDAAEKSYHLVVVNAGNREKILAWIEQHLPTAGDVQMTDLTREMAMIAVQGPLAIGLADAIVSVDPSAMKYYTACEATIGSVPGIVSRTGYTGEDGVELILPAESAQVVWEQLLAAGESQGVMAVGLGARDTLRLEAAMPLYGHELTEDITPQQAGLDFAVNLEGRDFHGSAAMRDLANKGPLPKRVGLVGLGRRVPREGSPVLFGDQVIGEVSSGTHSPTLEQPIAMAYVDADHAAVDTEVTVDIRGRKEPAKIVPLPFYKRQS